VAVERGEHHDARLRDLRIGVDALAQERAVHVVVFAIVGMRRPVVRVAIDPAVQLPMMDRSVRVARSVLVLERLLVLDRLYDRRLESREVVRMHDAADERLRILDRVRVGLREHGGHVRVGHDLVAVQVPIPDANAGELAHELEALEQLAMARRKIVAGRRARGRAARAPEEPARQYPSRSSADGRAEQVSEEEGHHRWAVRWRRTSPCAIRDKEPAPGRRRFRDRLRPLLESGPRLLADCEETGCVH
jgi:hypothetical protein